MSLFLDKTGICAAIDGAREVFGPLHIVCAEDNSSMFLAAYLVEKSQYEFAIVGIEIASRFVCQDDFGVVEEGASDADALLFAVRQFVDELVLLVSELDHFEDFDDALVAFRLFLPACGTQYEVEIAMYSTVREQLEVLEHDAHLSA